MLRSALLRRLSCLVLALLAALVAGCASPVSQLHPVSGDEFSVLPTDRQSPPPITCSGSLDERCACFMHELEQSSQAIDAGGAFALAEPDGSVRSFTRTSAQDEAHPITDDTRLPVATITEMFLAAATVSLAQQGRIDLQQPIAGYVPELTQGKGVGSATLHQLLTHTSGLGYAPLCEEPTEDLPELLKKHGNERLYAPPGAVFNYSNFGYGFVAIVLERVTSQRFEDVVRERVLVPAGLPGARFGFEELTLRGSVPEWREPPRCRAMWPSAGLLLSIRELGRWAALLAHPESSPLGQPLIAALTAPHVPTEERPGGAHGYGVQRVQQGDVVVYSHPSGVEGFTSFVAWAGGLGVAVLADRNASYPITAGHRALSTFLSLSENWQPPPGPAHALGAYAGVYVDDAGTLGRLRVSVDGAELAIEYLDNPPPLSPPNFRFVFEPGAEHPRYVVTPVGVGERRGK